MGIEEVLKDKRLDIINLAEKYGVRNMRVFGSVARGTAGPESDVDFLVQLDPGVTLMKHAALIRELEQLLGRRVDVVSDRGLRERIKARVLKEAVAL
jgi:predicted nucleotidyltransferase